jgi:hypothetical protein
MEYVCPFEDTSHHPPGRRIIRSRRSFRRHLVCLHGHDIFLERDASGHPRDVLRPVSPAGLAGRVDAIRRSQGRAPSGRGRPSASMATPPDGPSASVAATPAAHTVSSSAPAAVPVSGFNLGEGPDFSAGVDMDLDLLWDRASFGDGLLELANPVAGVDDDWSDLLAAPPGQDSVTATPGPDSIPRGVQPAEGGGLVPGAGRPAVSVTEAGCQTEAPARVGIYRISQAVALATVAVTTRGPLRIAHNTARLVGAEAHEDLYAIDAAASTAVVFEEMLVDLLARRAAEGLLHDRTAVSSLATVVAELSTRQRRPAGFEESPPEPRHPRPLLPLPDLPIIIEDDDDDQGPPP